MKPSASATPRATVDLPAPAGPSIAITMTPSEDRVAPMQTWDVSNLNVEPHQPQVLASDDEGRVIAIQLPAGERLQEHQVHERAWLVVTDGEIEIEDSNGGSVTGGPGLLAAFDPNERHEVRATDRRAPAPPALALAGRGAPESESVRARPPMAAVALAVAVLAAAGCGGDDETSTAAPESTTVAGSTGASGAAGAVPDCVGAFNSQAQRQPAPAGAPGARAGWRDPRRHLFGRAVLGRDLRPRLHGRRRPRDRGGRPAPASSPRSRRISGRSTCS